MPLPALRSRLAEVADLAHAAAVLEWDQEVFMPPGGAEARAQQVATLRRVAHERFTDDAVGALLDAAEPTSETEAALVRVARRDWERAVRLPARLVSEKAEASGRAKEAWRAAREADDYGPFAPHLDRVFALAREEADLVRPLLADERGGEPEREADARYDALLDAFEPGARTADVARVFAALRAELVPLVAAVADRPAPDDSFLRAAYPETDQWAFGLETAEAFGYDLARGRQDRSAHPFTTSFGAGDVRVTTRLDERFFPTAFFGTVHEVGHALYEQGVAPELARTPLADAASLGLHESQSRLWENLVARSPAFWAHAYGRLQARFPDALGGVAEAAFVRAVNRVEPSLIRVEADELTYHLHVLLRFELERALLAGDLAAADLPEAWDEGMRELLGVAPPSDADGCLQDIHWSLGAVGYFPTYTLGTLMSAQLWEAAGRDLPGLDADVRAGRFRPLLGWLRDRVHRWGRVRTAGEVLERATGGGLDAGPWLAYARRKYGALYDLDA